MVCRLKRLKPLDFVQGIGYTGCMRQQGHTPGLPVKPYLVTDDGLTEVQSGTITALAIGPHSEDAFVGLTDHLVLY